MTDYSDISKLDKKELTEIISHTGDDAALYALADKVRRTHYGNKVYIRGLIEVSSYCKNNCLYCGIRASNANAQRYRLGKDDVLSCCKEGYMLGFRTFVLQGGEDALFTDEFVCDVVSAIKNLYPDCAVTLSLGERSYQSYKAMHDAGADRYLLRHETANPKLYSMLHPDDLSFERRKECLYNLKNIGYQVGAGFMVGAPYQTYKDLACDLLFLKELKPHMVGIGPFIPHHDTIFSEFCSGTVTLTLLMIALTRLMIPDAMIPATTALNSLDLKGHEHGLEHGANVIMPNLSPFEKRADYSLYDNKISTGTESAEGISQIIQSLISIGYESELSRGDHCSIIN